MTPVDVPNGLPVFNPWVIFFGLFFGIPIFLGGLARLLTGEPITSAHPMTGEPVPWTWIRFKGCNTAVASDFARFEIKRPRGA